LSREIKTEIEALLESTARDLTERGRGRVCEIELEEMSAGALFDAESKLVLAWCVAADARRHFADQVHRRQHTRAAAQSYKRRVAIDAKPRSRMVHPDRRRVQSRDISEPPRHHRSKRRRAPFPEVVGSLDGNQTRQRDRR